MPLSRTRLWRSIFLSHPHVHPGSLPSPQGQVQAPQDLFSVNISDRHMKTSDHLCVNNLFCSQSLPWFQPSCTVKEPIWFLVEGYTCPCSGYRRCWPTSSRCDWGVIILGYCFTLWTTNNPRVNSHAFQLGAFSLNHCQADPGHKSPEDRSCILQLLLL